MRLEVKDVNLKECATIREFIESVRKRTNNSKTGKQVVYYHIEKGTLDYVEYYGMKLVVLNDKAAAFEPGTYYKNSSEARKKNKSKKK